MARPFGGSEFNCLNCRAKFRRNKSQIARGYAKLPLGNHMAGTRRL